MTSDDRDRQSPIELLDRLVAFPTVSTASNLDLIEYAEMLLKKAGAQVSLSGRPSEGKANLFATFGDRDPNTGIVLSGHTDVVPAETDGWNSNPFELRIKDGRAFGRGSSDMKGFIAVCLSQAQKLTAMELSRPLHIALSFDEELACRGIPLMFTDLQTRGVRPWGCVIGEPTDMSVVVGHKGSKRVRCSMHGKAAHSSQPATGVNAIHFGAKIISFVGRLADRFRTEGPFDDNYDVNHSTLLVTEIKGGEAGNMVPQRCVIGLQVRNIPKHDPFLIIEMIKAYANAEVLPSMQARDPDVRIDFEIVADVPAFERHADSAIVQLVVNELNTSQTAQVGFGTEAGLYESAGIPTVICGPGSIAQAHQVNECLELSRLDQAELFVAGLVRNFCLPPNYGEPPPTVFAA